MASFPTAGATLMPLAIASFRAAHPEVELTLAEGEPEEIAPRLRAGEFDLALLFEFRGVGESLGSGLRSVSCSRIRCTWRCPRDHPLADRPTLRLADLREEPWVADVGGAAPARATSCAPATPPASSPTVSFESDDYADGTGPGGRGRGRRADPPARAQRACAPTSWCARSRRARRSAASSRPRRATRRFPAAAAMIEVLAGVARRYGGDAAGLALGIRATGP